MITEFHNRELFRYELVLEKYQKRLFKKNGETIFQINNNNLNVNYNVNSSNSQGDISENLVFGVKGGMNNV